MQNEVEQVTALGSFHVFATMNPGGDFGKKEVCWTSILDLHLEVDELSNQNCIELHLI